MVVECHPPRSRALLHISRPGVGRHQIAVPGFDLSRANRIPAELPGLCSAGRVQSHPAWHPVRFPVEHRRIPGLLRAGMGARHGAAGIVWRRIILELVSARRLSARQLGVPRLLPKNHRTASLHVSSGFLLHDRILCYPDDSHEKFTDGKPGSGLRAHGICQGSQRAASDFRSRPAQLPDPHRHGPRARRQHHPGRLVPDREGIQY